MNTAAITSKITYIDGLKGVLRHRGYGIEELAEKSDFLETAYLLVSPQMLQANFRFTANFPQRSKINIFRNEVMSHTYIADDLTHLIRSFRFDAHPMSIFIATFAAMSAYAPEANPALQGRDLYTRDYIDYGQANYKNLGESYDCRCNGISYQNWKAVQLSSKRSHIH